MDPALITCLVMSVMNTTRLILQHFMSCKSEEESMLPALLCVMERKNSRLMLAFMEQLHTVDHRYWAQEASTEWWNRIVMQVLFNIFINDLDNGTESTLTKFVVDPKLGGVASALEDRIKIQNGLDKLEK
ncbi:hypothetical protein UY3_17466 [Chelonia mydas]|uniref:Uncharacterized protein n=1 Tax=Chelonia mydas TaxID=8469 RepID=M7BB47_CHEMY|nr:hypothetical protein UY3_17466 [Chelonia mydas]